MPKPLTKEQIQILKNKPSTEWTMEEAIDIMAHSMANIVEKLKEHELLINAILIANSKEEIDARQCNN